MAVGAGKPQFLAVKLGSRAEGSGLGVDPTRCRGLGVLGSGFRAS